MNVTDLKRFQNGLEDSLMNITIARQNVYCMLRAIDELEKELIDAVFKVTMLLPKKVRDGKFLMMIPKV